MRILGTLAALLVLGIVYQRIDAARCRRQFPPPGRLFRVNGHRLHAHCVGAGSPLVLLESGIAASSLSWTIVQPAIAKFTRVCAYDRAGLAWSDPPSCPRTFDRIVDELSGLLSHVGPHEQYVLVGHSFGCFVVCAYARRHPERMAGLVLVDPAFEWLSATPQRVRMLRGGRQLSRLGAVLAHIGVVRASLALLSGGAPGAARWVAKLFGATAAQTLERLVGEVRKLPSEVHPIVQALWCQPKCFGAMADHLLVFERSASTAAAVPPHEVPLVVISSANQPPEHLDAHRSVAAASLHGRHVIAARSSHWVQFDEPELIVAVVQELTDAQRSATAV